MRTRSCGSRYSRCPRRTSKASYHASMFRTVEMRKFSGAIVARDLPPQGILAYLAAPAARECDEELPILLPDIFLVVHFVAERATVGVECDRQAAEIGH